MSDLSASLCFQHGFPLERSDWWPACAALEARCVCGNVITGPPVWSGSNQLNQHGQHGLLWNFCSNGLRNWTWCCNHVVREKSRDVGLGENTDPPVIHSHVVGVLLPIFPFLFLPLCKTTDYCASITLAKISPHFLCSLLFSYSTLLPFFCGFRGHASQMIRTGVRNEMKETSSTMRLTWCSIFISTQSCSWSSHVLPSRTLRRVLISTPSTLPHHSEGFCFSTLGSHLHASLMGCLWSWLLIAL